MVGAGGLVRNNKGETLDHNATHIQDLHQLLQCCMSTRQTALLRSRADGTVGLSGTLLCLQSAGLAG